MRIYYLMSHADCEEATVTYMHIYSSMCTSPTCRSIPTKCSRHLRFLEHECCPTASSSTLEANPVYLAWYPWPDLQKNLPWQHNCLPGVSSSSPSYLTSTISLRPCEECTGMSNALLPTASDLHYICFTYNPSHHVPKACIHIGRLRLANSRT